MLAQLVQNLVHLERSENRFDQHRGANGSAGNAQIVLREIEHVIPQAGFVVALQLRQIKVGRRSAADLVLGVVKEKQSKIEQRAGNRLAVHQEMLFIRCQPRGRTRSVAVFSFSL